jgi:hypothetical protein
MTRGGTRGEITASAVGSFVVLFVTHSVIRGGDSPTSAARVSLTNQPMRSPALPRNVQQGSVAATVANLARGTRPSDTWRSAAFTILRLNPKECEALGRVFEDEDAADERRVLVLDLLAGAGTFEAQVVMRRLLALAIARRDSKMFVTYVQRLGFVEHPDGPTLRFLMSVLAESRGEALEIRAACAYALGAAAGHAYRAGDHDAAIRASDVLRRDLLRASTAREKAAFVTALGNAGIPHDAPTVMRFVHDAEASVRAAAALALRLVEAPEAKAKLLEMITDADEKVAHSALVGLSAHRLDEDDLDRLAELVLAGRTSLALDGAILRLVVAHGGKLQPQGTGHRRGVIENALRLLLGRVETGVPSGMPGTSGEHPVVRGGQRMIVRAGGSAESWTKPSQGVPLFSSAYSSSAPPPPSSHSDEELTIARPVRPIRGMGGSVGSSGSYRMVHEPGRLQELGLDPNARTSNIPSPPQTRGDVSPMATIRRR